MNTQTDTTPTTQELADPHYQQCFRDIDRDDFHDSQWFEISMLRLGRILTKNESPIFSYTGAKVARAMQRHKSVILGSYRPMDIREKLSSHMGGEILGGGIRVEYCEEYEPRRRNDPPHYNITFSRIYWHNPHTTPAAVIEPPITQPPKIDDSVQKVEHDRPDSDDELPHYERV